MTKKKTSHPPTTNESLLFSSDMDWWHNAYLYEFHRSWNSYAAGYRKAAEVLVEHCSSLSWGRNNPYYEKNTLVYPIIFLYRQYVELTLKKIIQEGNKVVVNPQPLRLNHKLKELWDVCRHIIQERELPISVEDLSSLESYVEQFSKFDPGATTFRYPVTTQDKPSLPPTLTSISLRRLADAMQKCATLLERTSAYLEADVDLEREFREDFYPEPF